MVEEEGPWPPKRGYLWRSEVEDDKASHCNSRSLLNETYNRLWRHVKMEMQERTLTYVYTIVCRSIPRRMDEVMQRGLTRTLQLEVTLCYLATGYPFTFLSHIYKISVPMLRKIIPETCRVISDQVDICSPGPWGHSRESWRDLAMRFEDIFGFPNCIGVLDTAPMTVTVPDDAGMFGDEVSRNLSLLVVVDSRFQIVLRDVVPDVQEHVVRASSIGRAWAKDDKVTKIPPPERRKRNTVLPYVMIGREVSPLEPYLITPYSNRIISERDKRFNARLYMAFEPATDVMLRMIANFNVLRIPMKDLSVEDATVVATACVALHNCLMSRKDVCYNEIDVRRVAGTRSFVDDRGEDSNEGKPVRDLFRDYLIRSRSHRGIVS